MAILLGFILGIVTSFIASLLFSWIGAVLPLEHQGRILGLVRNPILSLKLKLDTEEAYIAERIKFLFQAWERKDLDSYLLSWSDDAVKIIGTKSSEKSDKIDIGRKFEESCHRYSEIRVPMLIFESIDIAAGGLTAIAFVHYKFSLIRSHDFIPVVEHSREVYSLRKDEYSWLVVSNIDHFYEITPGRILTQ